MANRPRQSGESYDAYRRNLKNEDRLLKYRLSNAFGFTRKSAIHVRPHIPMPLRDQLGYKFHDGGITR